MKLLAIESSGLVASAAVFADDTIVAEFTVNNKQTHSQTLLPMIDQVVTMSGIDLKEIDAIATTSGPGSFTGLRIGAATAKGLGLAATQTDRSDHNIGGTGISTGRQRGKYLPDDGCET